MNFDQNLLPIVLGITIWELIWKAIAAWHAAQNGQKFWFVFIMFLNTAGILPIVYLKFFQKKNS